MKKTLKLLLASLLVSGYSNAQIPAYLPFNGLVAWFPFTGNAVDSTGNGHTGTVNGTTNAKGRYGVPNTAFRFNGTSDYIYIPAGSHPENQSIDITSSLTISAWVKSYNYFFTPQQQIYWRGDPQSAHDPHMLYLNGGQVRLRRDVDPGATTNEVGYSLNGLDTNYHLFTGTFDSATGIQRIYVDGVMKNSTYLPGKQTYSTSSMYNYIGAVDGGTWQFFYGFIDELAIWRRALTPCEVATLYSSVPNVVITQPANAAVVAGNTATFSVSVSAPSPGYQWQVNPGSGYVNLANNPPYSGVNTATLVINPATTSLSGYSYRCVADSCAGLTTNGAKLFVWPVNVKTLPTGESFHISVAPNPASGSFTISGQAADDVIVADVVDMSGKLLQSEELIPLNGHVKKTMTLNKDISNGIYLLRLRSKNISEVFRIVLER